MANVVLDAMIKRADFAQQTEDQTIELFDKFDIGKLEPGAPILEMLRKPDFQRETNHWKPDQIAELIYSFANGQLIPSLILWKSSAHVFVIDGGHRLSALKAWVNNDYGDGPISHGFFDGEIPESQKRIAKATRAKVEKRVARFSDIKAALAAKESDAKLKALATTTFTRTIPVQWIQGSQEVAEVSFFKINSQGTALDQTEELILRNRKKSYAIAARAIVRAGTGNRYWSGFDGAVQSQIELSASTIHNLLFQPEIQSPIKTLDLPIGGTTSPVDAIKMLLDIFALWDGEIVLEKSIKDLADDSDGKETLKLLKSTERLVRRITGNEASSLGLHPAIYFYNEKGRHSRFLFLGTIKFIAAKTKNKDTEFFRKFTSIRQKLETLLMEKKAFINQALANVNSNQRIDRVSDLLSGITKDLLLGKEVELQNILAFMGLKGKISEVEYLEYPGDFSLETKSAAFLAETLKSAPSCSVCGALLDVPKSVSYDHIIPKKEGGDGAPKNVQLTHPFCNTTVKN